MRHLKSINEYYSSENPLVTKFVEILDKTLYERLGKTKPSQYWESGHKIWDVGENSVSMDRGFGGVSSTGLNEYEKKDETIKYRYETQFKKFFNVRDNDPVEKQIKMFEKQVEIMETVKAAVEYIEPRVSYCEVRIVDSAKTYIEFQITCGFSESVFNMKALRSLNKKPIN